MAAPVRGGDSGDAQPRVQEDSATAGLSATAAAAGAAAAGGAAAAVGTDPLAGRVSSVTTSGIRQVDGATFRAAIVAAKEGMRITYQGKGQVANAYRAVDVYSAEEYDQMQPFLYEDNKTGFAIKDGDEIVSVFRHQSAGSLRALMEHAIQRGGRRLDCFEETPHPLPNIYANYGFVPIAKVKYDSEQTPPGWDKSIEADVIFMVYDKVAADGLPTDNAARRDQAAANTEARIAAITNYSTYENASRQAEEAVRE